jgi:hypothetical protein
VPGPWKDGILEWWNIGKYQQTLYPKPIIPTFHYSNIPIAKQSGAQFLKPGKTRSKKVYPASRRMSNE